MTAVVASPAVLYAPCVTPGSATASSVTLSICAAAVATCVGPSPVNRDARSAVPCVHQRALEMFWADGGDLPTQVTVDEVIA